MYLYAGDMLVAGGQVKFSDVFPDLIDAFNHHCLSESDTVFLTHGVTIRGLEYRKGCAVRL